MSDLSIASDLEANHILTPPSRVIKMTEWNPELFKKTISVPYLSVKDENLSKLPKSFKPRFLKVPNLAPIQRDPDLETKKRVLFNPDVVRKFEDIVEKDQHFLESVIGVGKEDFGQMDVELTVENYLPKTMLKVVLSTDESEGLSAFSRIGHIIHVNLKDHLIPYKTVIGQILLRLPNIRIVVNKASTIDNTYRNFQMDIIGQKAKEEKSSTETPTNDFIVTVRENGTTYMFDFSKVYWNPRLSNEHERIVDLMQKSDIVFDVFAGVGPFSVLAVKKSMITKQNPLGRRVYANDLNPESYRWLKHNFTLNKLPEAQYSCFNKDGKDFIKEDVKEGLINYFKSEELERNVLILMNLPALAIEFLHHFHGVLKDVDTTDFKAMEAKSLPTVHVYGFSKADDTVSDIKSRCQDQFDGKTLPDLEVTFARNVAPHKDMMRATFNLSLDLLKGQSDSSDEPETKKMKSE